MPIYLRKYLLVQVVAQLAQVLIIFHGMGQMVKYVFHQDIQLGVMVGFLIYLSYQIPMALHSMGLENLIHQVCKMCVNQTPPMSIEQMDIGNTHPPEVKR
jgi:hypothetical protein